MTGSTIKIREKDRFFAPFQHFPGTAIPKRGHFLTHFGHFVDGPCELGHLFCQAHVGGGLQCNTVKMTPGHLHFLGGTRGGVVVLPSPLPAGATSWWKCILPICQGVRGLVGVPGEGDWQSPPGCPRVLGDIEGYQGDGNVLL